jgi:ubiquinone/menaquinone biosynthesis C-methylase UbiE
MGSSGEWRRVWEEKSTKGDVADFDLDRGVSPRDQEIEQLSERELVSFLDPVKSETVLDAGCGTGVSILRLHGRVRRIIGIDYAWGSLERCRRRIHAQGIESAHICLASVSDIPLPDCSVDKVICLSVLQYLGDDEVRRALREFIRVLRPKGTIVLHVKNRLSLYWSTLWMWKELKAAIGVKTEMYALRSFNWYERELASLNCRIVDYNSLNLFAVEGTPKGLLSRLQRFELRHCNGVIFRSPFVRRHGAELKIKSMVRDCDGAGDRLSRARD